MKYKFSAVFAVSALVIISVFSAFGQNDIVRSAAGDKYVISAKAGGVNHIEGDATIDRAIGKSGILLKGDEIEVGDRVSTGKDGRAEILLNPGSYLRVGNSAAFEFISTDLDDLRLKLRSGSGIFEVIAADEFRVTVLMPRTAVALTRSGVYRLDVLPDGSSKVSVWKGKMFFGPDNKTEIKAGRTASIAGVQASVAKFDRDELDILDAWSKERAKGLTKLNARLQRKSLRDTLMNGFNRRSWNMYSSFGLWVFDRTSSMWTFLPFGYGWGSPYGYGYGSDIWTCRLPRWVYNEPPWTPSTPGGVPLPGPNPNIDRARRLRRPTFDRPADGVGDSGGGIITRRGQSPTVDVPQEPTPVFRPPVISGGGRIKGKPDQ